jgi:glycosyltransferase involved in cell wall biosynthesis
MNVLILPRHSTNGASSRLRLYQFAPALEAAGLLIEFQPLISRRLLVEKYQTGRYSWLKLLFLYSTRIIKIISSRRSRLLWIEKEALPWLPVSFETRLLSNRPFVLDFDDAVFHNYDQHSNWFVRYLMSYRIDKLMASARLVIVGNKYLAARALQAGAKWVEIIPTVVDMERYDSCSVVAYNDLPRVVWIGSPSSLQYLLEIGSSLRRLMELKPFVLRVIGGGRVEMPGVQVECIGWSEEAEVGLIKECHIGIMPLRNGAWEEGKCAYKLIQYMACGLPTVASAVGANCEVVLNGETGFLVSSGDQWVEQLSRLLDDGALREKMGRAGHSRSTQHYSLRTVAPRLESLLRQAGEGMKCAD